MNNYLLAAAALSVFVGLVHSILGERLMFRKLRRGSVVPCISAKPLIAKNIRIIWATWHLASVFGFATGAVFFHLAGQLRPDQFVLHALASAMLISGLLVLYATNGKHPGWVGLSGVAILCWVSQ